MSLNELNERDFYEEPGVNIFEVTVDGKKEWLRKTTLDAINAVPGETYAGIRVLQNGQYTRNPLTTNKLPDGLAPIIDSAGLQENTKVDVLEENSAMSAFSASFGGQSWLKWAGFGAVALIGLNLLRRKDK